MSKRAVLRQHRDAHLPPRSAWRVLRAWRAAPGRATHVEIAAELRTLDEVTAAVLWTPPPAWDLLQ